VVERGTISIERAPVFYFIGCTFVGVFVLENWKYDGAEISWGRNKKWGMRKKGEI
jgi:hypothetical protein